ncbi:PREDICTED: rhomboid-like protein 14, mitochondrial isoform X6 [Brassica oleracea var. oleracea]|uniref:rhomboid-like protein 14, mitochondrial isoform X6 n=1 Tax=Brassica oleracea var. oleracea TaxID=109376 RepID=UPI0006A6A699|nr:PREDICTED: rhomboid-like protein 14, mitochondrial isoform X6 [Brassica oleracea var. oleracea]
MLTSELAARIMGPTEWLLNHEIDAMMYLFTEMTTLRRWEPSKVAFMSCMFSNQMKTSFEEFRKDKKKFKVLELLHRYDIGELPAHGRTRLMWDLDVTCMYVPLNVDQRERFISKRMANFGEGRRRGTGGMLPLLAISTVAEYYRLPWKPPVTAGLLAANTLVYLRPAFLDPLIPHISEVWFNPNLILKHKDLKRFFLSAFYHLNEPHLVYNMMSLLWKGIKLETSMGSTQFASMVVTLLGISQGVTLLLAKSLHVFFDYRRAYFHEYSVGFSGVLFALKVVLNAQAEDYSSVYGVLVPTKYAAWAELVLVQIFVPRASFLGHLGGILAGILYMKMKRSYSGSDPVAMVVRGVARAVTWPLRFLSSMVGSRRRRITGRGRVGRGQNGIAGPGIWRCQSCTFDNSGWESVCEMCGSGRSRGNGWSVNQGHAHSSSSSSDLPLDELRRRRVERFS